MADTYYLDINGISRHLDTDREFNEENYGAGVSVERGRDLIKMLAAGVFKNSQDRTSVYAGGGMAKRFGDDAYMDLGAIAGLITGYDKAVTPMVMPMASIGLKDLWKIRLMYAPEYRDSPATLMMNLGIPFK